jgi:hypothetical protein
MSKQVRVLRVLEYTFPSEEAAVTHLAQRYVKDVVEHKGSMGVKIREAFVGGILGFSTITDTLEEEIPKP